MFKVSFHNSFGSISNELLKSRKFGSNHIPHNTFGVIFFPLLNRERNFFSQYTFGLKTHLLLNLISISHLLSFIIWDESELITKNSYFHPFNIHMGRFESKSAVFSKKNI